MLWKGIESGPPINDTMTLQTCSGSLPAKWLQIALSKQQGSQEASGIATTKLSNLTIDCASQISLFELRPFSMPRACLLVTCKNPRILMKHNSHFGLGLNAKRTYETAVNHFDAEQYCCEDLLDDMAHRHCTHINDKASFHPISDEPMYTWQDPKRANILQYVQSRYCVMCHAQRRVVCSG